MQNNITLKILIVVSILFLTTCSKKLTENQQRYHSEQTAKKEKYQDSTYLDLKSAEQDLDKTFMIYFKEGKSAHNQGNYSEAIRLFEKCLSINPDFIDGFTWRGLSKLKSGNIQGACDDWNATFEMGSTKNQSLIDDYCN